MLSSGLTKKTAREAGDVATQARLQEASPMVGDSQGKAGELNRVAEERPLLHVLVVDDDRAVRTACLNVAEGMGFATVGAESLQVARTVLQHRKIDLLMLDLKLPDGDGLTLLEQVKTLYPEMAVVVMTAFATIASAIEAMRIGAGDYLTKPFALEELTAVLDRASQRVSMDVESRQLRERLRSQKAGLVGQSPEMEKLYRMMSKVAYTMHPVLILGESGTGKEIVARAVHSNGPNASKPFVPVDCGSLVPSLIESELFGHVKGAFTGADKTKEGLLAAADGGTVFLDEIGELPLDLQSKLLRALQEREVRPVGATQARPISARVLAATNRDLSAMVEQGRFRKDLYFRLNVVNLRIPALRERRSDIPLLAMHFVEKMQEQKGVKYTLSDETLRVLSAYDWPGNVRELENAIERACALSSGPVLHMGDLPTQLQDFRMHQATESAVSEIAATTAEPVFAGDDPIVSIAELERQAILGTIRQLNGDKLKAAKLLGIGKTTLYRKLKEYGIGDAEGQE
jgi:DNA-binding NtrC family response regulator